MIRLGVETGGTKILARIVDDGRVIADGKWPTTTPEDAADAIAGFVAASLPPGKTIDGAGMAAFGPLLIDPADPDCGRMLDTPKPGWTGSNLSGALAVRLGVPFAIDTDVNAAALAELRLGAGRGLPSVAYVTIGTGIGAGLAMQGGTLRGAMHPEAGHIRLIRAPDDRVASTCPFHSDCAEGLAAGPAVAVRLEGGTLAERKDVRLCIADYIAQLAFNLVLAWSPHRIVIGGGVARAPGMCDAVRAAYAAALGDYGVGPHARAADFIVPATLVDAGLEGALLMASNATAAS